MTGATRAVAASAAPGRTAGFLRRLPLHLTILLLMVIWLIPTIGLLVNSVRPPEALTQSGWWTVLFGPTELTVENYAHVMAQSNLADGFVNSLFISIPATIIPVLVAAFAAYAFAWMRFPGRDLLFVVVVGLLVVPLQSTLIPILQLYSPRASTSPDRSRGLAGPHWPGCPSPSTPAQLHGELPREVFESAAIDGASR